MVIEDVVHIRDPHSPPFKFMVYLYISYINNGTVMSVLLSLLLMMVRYIGRRLCITWI